MKILDRYILKQFLVTFLFAIALLLAIVTVIDYTEKTDKYSQANLTAAQILRYYADFIPWIAGLVTPLTAFIAVVFVTSRLAVRTEIIAALSSGVSLRRLLLPYFAGAFIIAAASFYLNGWVIPNSNKTRLAFEVQYLKKNVANNLRNIHLQLDKNVYFYMQSYNTLSKRGFQLVLERFDSNRLVEKLTATRIQWDTAKNTWVLQDWKKIKVEEIFMHTGQDHVAHLTESGTSLDTALAIHPKEFENDYRKYDGLTISELNEYIKILRARGSAGIEVYEVEKYTRFASPFTIFVLTFMGVIVSAKKSRGGTGFQIALGFVLSFFFIIIFFFFSKFFLDIVPYVCRSWIPSAFHFCMDTCLALRIHRTVSVSLRSALNHGYRYRLS
jgi:lipopolysaccharide export system permease protein